jgi:GPH family glycoside/pentoside/hexuronide:cation symporter
MENRVSIKEKIAYALGDASANIAWRGVSAFLLIFYVDVFGLTPAVAGMVLFIVRLSDGISDVAMGAIADRGKSKHGKFRPWILWTAIPLGVILSLLFTSPSAGWSMEWKIAYAFSTYLLFTLIYTANNIPYGALMAVMTDNHKERTSIGSYRMVGAFAGGMIVQGSLLFLVSMFGGIDNSTVSVTHRDTDKYEVVVSAPQTIEKVNIKTKAKGIAAFFQDGTALFEWNDTTVSDQEASTSKSFRMEANKPYSFTVTQEGGELSTSQILIINQQQGYSKSIYILSAILILCLFITYYYTRERVVPPAGQQNNLKRDFIDLIHNKPWVVLLFIGLLFNVYNAIKQGITVIYFTHYIHNQLLAGSYMVCLMLASIAGAMATARLSHRFGKKNLFIGALLFSGAVNALIYFCNPYNITAIFTIGIVSEFAAAIFPTLFFVMLGDAAAYSEYVNGRRATGLVYSAGSFATKFGGGLAGVIIGTLLSYFGYNGNDPASIQASIPGIVMLMSWVPAVIAVITACCMSLYPLNQKRMDEITTELTTRRQDAELANSGL